MQKDLADISSALRSDSIERQAIALDRFFSKSPPFSPLDRSEVLSLAIAALARSSDPFFLGERIPRFGQEAIPPLEALLGRTNISAEVRVIAALDLTGLGSSAALPILLDEVQARREYRVLALRLMSRTHRTEHVAIMLDLLRHHRIDPTHTFPSPEDYEILSIFHNLQTLRIQLPDDIRGSFGAAAAPAFFRREVADAG